MGALVAACSVFSYFQSVFDFGLSSSFLIILEYYREIANRISKLLFSWWFEEVFSFDEPIWLIDVVALYTITGGAMVRSRVSYVHTFNALSDSGAEWGRRSLTVEMLKLALFFPFWPAIFILEALDRVRAILINPNVGESTSAIEELNGVLAAVDQKQLEFKKRMDDLRLLIDEINAKLERGGLSTGEKEEFERLKRELIIEYTALLAKYASTSVKIKYDRGTRQYLSSLKYSAAKWKMLISFWSPIIISIVFIVWNAILIKY